MVLDIHTASYSTGEGFQVLSDLVTAGWRVIAGEDSSGGDPMSIATIPDRAQAFAQAGIELYGTWGGWTSVIDAAKAHGDSPIPTREEWGHTRPRDTSRLAVWGQDQERDRANWTAYREAAGRLESGGQCAILPPSLSQADLYALDILSNSRAVALRRETKGWTVDWRDNSPDGGHHGPQVFGFRPTIAGAVRAWLAAV